MKRTLSLAAILFLAFLCPLVRAQIGNTTTIVFAGAPTGKCQPTQLGLNKSNGNLYSCNNGTWVISGGGAASSVPFSGITSGTNNSAAMLVGSGANVSPTGEGQVVSTGALYPYVSLAAPSLSFSATGGTLSNGQTLAVQYTFNSVLGETPGSTQATQQVNACTGGNQCSVTITAPSIPSGFTGYTAYTCVTPCTPKQQTTLSNCVNISGNCVVGTAGAGSSVPTVNTAFTAPTPLNTSACPSDALPTTFLQTSDGNWNTYSAVEPKSPNFAVNGVLTVCYPTFFNDTQVSSPSGNNAFVLIDHKYGVKTSTANQDRSLWLQGTTPTGDTSSHYALEGIQAELDLAQTGSGFGVTGSPDGEISTLSLQVGDTATANWFANGFGSNVIRAQWFKNGVGNNSSPGVYDIINAKFNIGEKTFTAGTQGIILDASCVNGAGGTISNLACAGVKFTPITNANRPLNGQFALYVPSGYTAGSNDFMIRNDSPSYNSWLNGQVTVGSLTINSVATLPISGSVTDTGSFTTAQPTGPTQNSGATCSGGASLYQYQLVGVDSNGNSAPGVALNTAGATCVNPLTAGNPATITASNTIANLTPFVRIDVYRTGGPMATGKIGSLTCTASGIITSFALCNSFVDSGLSASGTVPSVNTAGGITTPAGAPSHLAGNVAQVASNFTTAANTSLQTITGLTFNLSPSAVNYSFHCSLSYSQATGNAAVAFGIQAATNAPTNIFGNGTIQTNTTAYSGGTLATLSSTTATSIVSATPGATGTNFTATLDGTIEDPANTNGNVINFMVSTATSGDAVTVLRGSYCRLF